MRLFIILVFSFITEFTQGQISTSFDLIVSPEQSYRSLSPETDSLSILRNEDEVKKFALRFGANLNLYIGNTIVLKTGFRFVNSGYDSKTEDVNFDYKFFEIPIALRYYYRDNDKFLRPFTEIGVGIHIYRSGDFYGDDFLRLFNHALTVSVGIDYAYSYDFAFFVQPIFRYHLSQTLENYILEEHLYSFGGEIGIRFKL